MDQRLSQLTDWLNHQLIVKNIYHGAPLALTSVSGDASFRRYFRCHLPQPCDHASLIVVDAPPEQENCQQFVTLAQQFAAVGVTVPDCLEWDRQNGFMLLSDFGDTLLLGELNEQNVDVYYDKAMNLLLPIMRAEFQGAPLPLYDQALLRREMQLFPDWFCVQHLRMTLSESEHQLMTQVFSHLESAALSQDQVPVHRDYHSRNLMLLKNGDLGTIDFQDAVMGPISYDLLSLLRDAYIAWPEEKVVEWAGRFAAKLRESGLSSVDDATFWRWFNEIGAQRHLKVVGIFARLYHRDGKSGYLNDIPQTLRYLLLELRTLMAIGGPDCLHAFYLWLVEKVVPRLVEKQPDARVLLEVFR